MLGVTSYGDLTPVRAAAEPGQRLHPVDRRRGVHARPRARPGGAEPAQVHPARSASRTPTSRSTCTARRAPRSTSRTTSCASCTASSTCSRTRRSSWRATSSARPRATSTALAPPFFKALMDYAQDGSYSWHCPGHSGGVAFLKSPVGQMFHQFFGENMLRADVCNCGRGTRPVARPHRPGGAERAQRGAHLQRRPLLLRHQRHQHQQQDGLAPHGGARRRGGGRPQLPQVDPARDHHDRRGAGVPDADAQPLRHHRPDSRERVRARGDQDARSPPTRCWPASMRARSSRAS